MTVPAVIHGAVGAEIELRLPESGEVRLRVYDALGRQRAELIRRACSRGRTIVRWSPTESSGERLASGLYFLKLETSAGDQTHRVVLLR